MSTLLSISRSLSRSSLVRTHKSASHTASILMANIERAELSRRPDETFDDFALRLYANSRQYGVNCYRIAEILNQESGLHKAENSWRIRYKDFRRGMEYQKFNDDQEAMVGERILCVSDQPAARYLYRLRRGYRHSRSKWRPPRLYGAFEISEIVQNLAHRRDDRMPSVPYRSH